MSAYMEITIRKTNTGRFQLVRDGEISHASVMGRDVFATLPEAEAALTAMLQRVQLANMTRTEQETLEAPYIQAYARLLQSPDLREMRQQIQEHYGNACHESKLTQAAQRASIRATGTISCIGRDIGGVYQCRADEMGSDADIEWQKWSDASAAYETEVDKRMTELGIPLTVRHGGRA